MSGAAKGHGISHETRIHWLQLYRSASVGPSSFRQLLNLYGGARQALSALPRHLERSARGGDFHICSREEAQREYENLTRAGGHLLTTADAQYPNILRYSDGAPPLISVLGNVDLLNRPIVGIVGARRASAAAMAHCRKVARAIGEAGWVVASGLAAGIDSAAHGAAVPTGTIAVVAGGVDFVYPPHNEELYRSIAERGAIVSEMRWSMQPQARHFPQRNRIIAALSRAVLIMEAATRSGSLITARMAAEMGREVWAAPGSAMDKRASGTNSLIRDGANMLLDTDELIAEMETLRHRHLADLHIASPASRQRSLQGELGYEASAPPPPLRDNQPLRFAATDVAAPAVGVRAEDNSPADGGRAKPASADNIREQLLAMLGTTPVPVNDLIAALGGDASAVRLALLEASLSQEVIHHSGDTVSIAVE